MNKPSDLGSIPGRRKFLLSASLGVASLLTTSPYVYADPSPITVQQVIDRILRDIPGAPYSKTVDVLITGNPDQSVSGIVTTMFPTLEVIQKVVEAKANLIIAHETPFYNHQDETDWLRGDECYLAKAKLLQEHGIAVFRFHDYWHRAAEDGIIMGNLRRLGWSQYFDPSNQRILRLPEPIALGTLVNEVKGAFRAKKVRVIGDIEQPCQTVYMAFGFMDSRMQIGAINEYKPDVILSGETREWETVERVRDGLILGANTSLVVLGHEVSEDAGMVYAAEWISQRIPTVPVTHVSSGDPFQFL